MLRVELRRRTLGARVAHQVVPPEVAARGERDVLTGAPDDHDLLHIAALEGFVDGGLERVGLAAAEAAVGGDHQLRPGVVDAVAQRLGGEAAEDDAVGRADPRAGQHRHGQLGNHRHVERHAVALRDAEALQHVGELADLPVQLAEGQHARVAGLAFPDDGGLVAPPGCFSLQVPIEAVVGDVELATDEPPGEGRLPLERLLPGLEPGHVFPGHLRPEALGVFRAELAVLLHLLLVPVGTVPEALVGLEDARLFEQRFDVGHQTPSWM